MHSNGTSPYPRGTETILLVEPEPETRVLAAFMLTRQGYRVLEARCAADALGTFEATQDRVDLLCTEALMNRVNGHELAEKLCSCDPEMKVLYLADADYERLT